MRFWAGKWIESGVAAIVTAILPSLIILLVLSLNLARAGAADDEILSASGFKMAGDENRMRIVLHFDRAFEPRWFLLRGPYRLVVELPETGFAIEPDATAAHGLVSIVRFGKFDDGHSRFIIGSSQPFIATDVAVKKNKDDDGFRLVIELSSSSAEQFDSMLAERAGLQPKSKTTAKSDRLGAADDAAQARKPFTVVLDPGHGGIDGGARGVNGTIEKTITLAFSLELRKKLQDIENIKVIMTRESDTFLRLSERVRVARQHEAELFISIHADTIRYNRVRGATVYTVSAKASDAVAQEIAEGENLADRIAGIAIDEQNHEVSDILLDLLRRETQSFSISFARSLIDEMSESIELINNPHRFAGFQVLTAPDVPSVLVELGYLSNPKDEALLRDAKWRSRAVESIAAAIEKFARGHSEMGG